MMIGAKRNHVVDRIGSVFCKTYYVVSFNVVLAPFHGETQLITILAMPFRSSYNKADPAEKELALRNFYVMRVHSLAELYRE